MINEIYNEDCFERFKAMNDDSVDYVFTSPPYNRKRNDKYDDYNDDIDDYFSFLKDVINESIRISRNHVFLNIQKNYYNAQDVYRIMGEFHLSIVETFIWEKSNPLPTGGGSVNNAYEFIIVFGSTRLKSNNTYTKNHICTSVSRPVEGHRAVMKREVADFFIRNFTQKGEVIYDPFMGVGTTAISCKSLGRCFLGSELSSKYWRISIERTKDVQTELF